MISEVNDNYRLPMPKNCPEFLYGLMLGCWTAEAKERPWFKEVFQHLLGAWHVCTPITAFAKAAKAGVSDDYEVPTAGGGHRKVHKASTAGTAEGEPNYENAEDEEYGDAEEGDMYDLGGGGGQVRKRKQKVAMRDVDEDEEDEAMYDLGGTGGQVKKKRAYDDDDEEGEYEDADGQGEPDYDTADDRPKKQPRPKQPKVCAVHALHVCGG